MRPDDKRISQSIRPFEQDDEEGDDDARDRADDKRQNGQDREAPILSFRFVPTSQFRDHSRAGFRPSEDESQLGPQLPIRAVLRLGEVVVARSIRLSATCRFSQPASPEEWSSCRRGSKGRSRPTNKDASSI
jgi:hypothetical protein